MLKLRNIKINIRLIYPSLIFAFLLSTICSLMAQSTTLSIGAEYSSSYKIAEPVYSPEPEISPELHEQCFKSCCIAKFLVKATGKTSVELVTSSGCAEVDDMALVTLRRWKFKPATLDGQAVDSSRKIRVEFEVE